MILHHTNDPMPYPRAIGCDVDVTIRRGQIGHPLLRHRTTNAVLMRFGSTNAFYDLGYFESGMRGTLTMIVSNSPSRHDDSVCHARVEVIEILPK